jgi:hypothetical protein
MQIPKWFYIIIAAAAVIFAAGSALRNISTIGADRFSYHPETSSHNAVVFDKRTGTTCEWIASRSQNPSKFACLDYPGRRRDLWQETAVRHFAEEPAAELDTGMKMMDSAALMDSIARADSLRRR